MSPDIRQLLRVRCESHVDIAMVSFAVLTIVLRKVCQSWVPAGWQIRRCLYKPIAAKSENSNRETGRLQKEKEVLCAATIGQETCCDSRDGQPFEKYKHVGPLCICFHVTVGIHGCYVVAWAFF